LTYSGSQGYGRSTGDRRVRANSPPSTSTRGSDRSTGDRTRRANSPPGTRMQSSGRSTGDRHGRANSPPITAEEDRRRRDSGFQSLSGRSRSRHRREPSLVLATGDEIYDRALRARAESMEAEAASSSQSGTRVGQLTWRNVERSPTPPPPERRYRRGRQGTPECF
jgi:hypothetical protein